MQINMKRNKFLRNIFGGALTLMFTPKLLAAMKLEPLSNKSEIPRFDFNQGFTIPHSPPKPFINKILKEEENKIVIYIEPQYDDLEDQYTYYVQMTNDNNDINFNQQKTYILHKINDHDKVIFHKDLKAKNFHLAFYQNDLSEKFIVRVGRSKVLSISTNGILDIITTWSDTVKF